MKKIYLSLLLLLAVYFSSAQNNCGTAVAITSLPYTSGTLTTCGTGDDYAAGTLFNSNYGGGEDYVFSYTVTSAPQTILINLGGTTDNYKIASVHSACPPTSANALGGVATGSGTTGSASVTLPANGTYYIIIDTWPDPDCAEFTLGVSVAPAAPANDVCSGATVIPGAGPFPYLTGATSNVSATNAGDPSNTCQSNANNGIWYSFTPSTTGEYTISTCQSVAPLSTIADNVLSVFTSAAGCTGPFTQVACDDDACTTLGNQAVTTAMLTSGTTYYILVSGYNTNTGDAQLHIAAPITCLPPTGLTAGNITTTTADISFTGTGSFILEYGLAGFTPGTGATAGTGGTVINPAVSPQGIGGLSAATVYEVYVRQNCTGTGGGYSVNSAPVSFSTACGGAVNLPYTQNFDAVVAPALPVCTSVENVNGGNTWQTVSDDDDVPHSAPNMLRYDYESAAPGDDWFFTAGLNLTSGTTYQLKFWVRNSDGTDYTEKLEVKYGASATAAGMTSAALYSNTNIDFDSFQEMIVNFTVPSTGVYYLGFHEFSDADQAYLCLDDINVAVAPAPLANDECAGALTIGVAPIAATTTGAGQTLPANICSGGTSSAANDAWFQFTTTAGGTAVVTVTGNTVDVVVEAFSGTCGSLVTAGCVDAAASGGETLTLNGLLPSTTYYVRVFGWNGLRGDFNIAVSGAALPVTIEYFRGTKQNGRNVLDWKVSCYNSPSVTLVLERSSDGRQFKDISTTTESAVRCLQPFNYNDLSPAKGINYYRLKSIDVDRKISYSNVVALLNTDKGFEIVSLAPNPVRDEAILSVTSAEKSIMEIVVSDLNGKQVSKQRVNLIAGNNQLLLNLKHVAAGTYQVTGLTADGLSRTLRFVKQ